MVRGEQVRPTRPVTDPRAMPRRPRRPLTALELASWTELQHWMLPVLHWLDGPESTVVVTGGAVVVIVVVVGTVRVISLVVVTGISTV